MTVSALEQTERRAALAPGARRYIGIGFLFQQASRLAGERRCLAAAQAFPCNICAAPLRRQTTLRAHLPPSSLLVPLYRGILRLDVLLAPSCSPFSPHNMFVSIAAYAVRVDIYLRRRKERPRAFAHSAVCRLPSSAFLLLCLCSCTSDLAPVEMCFHLERVDIAAKYSAAVPASFFRWRVAVKHVFISKTPRRLSLTSLLASSARRALRAWQHRFDMPDGISRRRQTPPGLAWTVFRDGLDGFTDICSASPGREGGAQRCSFCSLLVLLYLQFWFLSKAAAGAVAVSSYLALLRAKRCGIMPAISPCRSCM